MDVIQLDDDDDEDHMEAAVVVDGEELDRGENQSMSRKRPNVLRAKILEYLPAKRSKSSEQPSEEPSGSFMNAFEKFHGQNTSQSPHNPPQDSDPGFGESTPEGHELPTGPPMLINITPLPVRRRKKGFAKAFEKFVEKK
jgi:hypothetical protein